MKTIAQALRLQSYVRIATRLSVKPQDYVKWRGPLFLRFLLALVDDSPGIRALAEFLLSDTLASKVLRHAENLNTPHSRSVT